MNKKSTKLNKRQEEILAIFEKMESISVSEVLAAIKKQYEEKVSKITINRDLNKLLEFDWLVKTGKGKAVVYKLSPHYDLTRKIDAQSYFQSETDKRKVRERLNFEIFSLLKKAIIFTDSEMEILEKANKDYQRNIKKISGDMLKREFERLVVELSWKSSQIEGNTYSLLETELLIKENKEPSGHTKEEAIMILNHKKALDYIRENKNIFKNVSMNKIEDIHYLLTKGLRISRGLRKTAVGITGTKYKPLDNEFQIKDALEETCRLVNKEKNSFSKALLIMLLIAYIQPFVDGNKRTSRLIGNAILIAHNTCPLSYRNVDEVEYKKAIILFYEQNNINYFKTLFIEQFRFAVNSYFRVKI